MARFTLMMLTSAMISRFHVIKNKIDIVTTNEIHLILGFSQYKFVLFNPNGPCFPDNNWAIYSGLSTKLNYYIGGMEYTREAFIVAITNRYPDDMTWILFHQEVLDGTWNG